MTKGVYDGLWRFGQTLFAYDGASVGGRGFRGFLEPMSLNSGEPERRDKAGIVPTEHYLLIAEPKEAFAYGKATLVVLGSTQYELLSVKELHDGEKISHRECVLLKIGEVETNA